MSTPSLPPLETATTTSRTQKKHYICTVCERGFNTRGHLARHGLVHTGERNHKCPFPGCERKFSRRDNLKQHYRGHLPPGSPRKSGRKVRHSISPPRLDSPPLSPPPLEDSRLYYFRHGNGFDVDLGSPPPSDSPPLSPPPFEDSHLHYLRYGNRFGMCRDSPPSSPPASPLPLVQLYPLGSSQTQRRDSRHGRSGNSRGSSNSGSEWDHPTAPALYQHNSSQSSLDRFSGESDDISFLSSPAGQSGPDNHRIPHQLFLSGLDLTGTVRKLDRYPFDSGGSADIYTGALSGSKSLVDDPQQCVTPQDPGIDLVDAFLQSQEWRTRRTVLLAQGLSGSDLREALRVSDQHICTSLLAVLGSRDAKRAVPLLEGTRAEAFLNAAQGVLDRGSLQSANDTSRARRLIIRLSQACDKLPASLFIPGVTDRDEHPTFSGGFGDIYRASYNSTTVALKRIRVFMASADSPQSCLQFCREALVWQTLRHKYVLPLIGIDCETFSSFCMVSPWMQYGTILRYLSEHGRADVDKMLLQIAEGLAYLHSMKIVHGDLRGTNILVSDDWTACLADFGLASIIDDPASTTSGARVSTSNHAGSPRWFAPELLVPSRFGCDRFVRTTASDMYAFACVCIELHTGRPPFLDVSQDAEVMMKVVNGERPYRPASMSDYLWDIVTAAWAQDFHARPGMEKLIKSWRTPEDRED